MYKIIKTTILGSEVTGNIGVNVNYRSTMGYDSSTKTISVKVEKIIRNDLTREETVAITYQVVAERDFTVNDFVRQGDHNQWCVDFDTIKETITAPLNTLEFGAEQRVKYPNFKFSDIRSALTSRYSFELVPLFIIKSLDNIDNFDHSLLTFLVPKSEQNMGVYDTIITNTDVEEMTFEQRSNYFNLELTPRLQVEILNLEGQLVATPTKIVSTSAPDGVTPIVIDPLFENRLTVTLPVADAYKIRYTFTRPNFKDTTNAYTVTVINGNVNKNRIIIGEGTEEIVLNSSYLTAGDFTKVKLNLGLYQSFSEVFITYA